VAKQIGDVQARLLLGLFYFLILAAFALVLRRRSDPLALKPGSPQGWQPKARRPKKSASPGIFFNMIRHREIFRATALLGLVIGVTLVQNWVLPIPILRELPFFTIHGPLYSFSARLYASQGKFARRWRTYVVCKFG
jgi:hypothetical protein